ncbi:hypothetical protein [Chitinophaga varians]|uniref:hypothetical protein n=1 Tax=Chitinophaga varians TaxID=2202339 RepID=UPI00165FC6B7|nr:hypothetical protein [Chitinophaga varians]MBC9913200.1 hypothetical protein [Chitinophaga varians]
METFELIVNGVSYHISPKEEGGEITYSTNVNGREMLFKPENGHLKAVSADLPEGMEDLVDGIAHAIETYFL